MKFCHTYIYVPQKSPAPEFNLFSNLLISPKNQIQPLVSNPSLSDDAIQGTSYIKS